MKYEIGDIVENIMDRKFTYEILNFDCCNKCYEVRCFKHGSLVTPDRNFPEDIFENYTDFRKSHYRNIKLNQLGI